MLEIKMYTLFYKCKQRPEVVEYGERVEGYTSNLSTAAAKSGSSVLLYFIDQRQNKPVGMWFARC